MTPSELKRVIEEHEAWLEDSSKGKRAHLSCAILYDADLRGAYLNGANLRNVNLRGADLADANLRDVNLSGACLTNANLADANLRRADLADANLRGAELRGADLRDAYLPGVDLRRADLAGAKLRGADLRGSDLRDAELPDGYAIASLCFGGWPVTITAEQTSIGCQTNPNTWWLRASPDDVRDLHPDAREWWGVHGKAVRAVIRCVQIKGELEDAETTA